MWLEIYGGGGAGGVTGGGGPINIPRDSETVRNPYPLPWNPKTACKCLRPEFDESDYCVRCGKKRRPKMKTFEQFLEARKLDRDSIRHSVLDAAEDIVDGEVDEDIIDDMIDKAMKKAGVDAEEDVVQIVIDMLRSEG